MAGMENISTRVVVSRRESIRTGFRALALVGLGGMLFFLSRRTGQCDPCHLAGCRNCRWLSHCSRWPATEIRKRDVVAGPAEEYLGRTGEVSDRFENTAKKGDLF